MTIDERAVESELDAIMKLQRSKRLLSARVRELIVTRTMAVAARREFVERIEAALGQSGTSTYAGGDTIIVSMVKKLSLDIEGLRGQLDKERALRDEATREKFEAQRRLVDAEKVFTDSMLKCALAVRILRKDGEGAMSSYVNSYPGRP